MSARGLQTLVATALTDAAHRELLLSRSPAAYEGFDLSAEERAPLLSIKAGTLRDFALQAYPLFYDEDLGPERGAGADSAPPALSAQDCA